VNVLELINNGDTIQMGIGGIPEAVVAGLDGKHDLGVLTELFPIGLQNLVAKGIVTNSRKPFHKGVTVATFCVGDQAMSTTHHNPACEFYPASYTNNPAFIAQHPNVVAINMALMVDFSGQIASEGLGHRMVSGSGGQLDFMTGAFYSPGGKGVTVMTAARLKTDAGLVHRAGAPGGNAHHGPQDLRQLRHHGVRHRPPALQEPPRAGRGPHRNRPPRPAGRAEKVASKEFLHE
jgi:4-hydroxybutyrate CoA-transferase